ncbi:MAG: hypothetical protein AB1499_10465 [Nitrospirota bacterium]
MKQSSYTIQGVNLHLQCDQRLYSKISKYLNYFYAGKLRPNIKPLTYNLSIKKDPPPVPVTAVASLKAEYMTFYRDGADSYYTLHNGSIIRFSPLTGTAEGFIRKESLNDTARLLSFIGAPISENLKFNSLYCFHSAALEKNGVGYLFSGDSGSGKTTTTLSLVSAGFKYVSDDVVLLEETDEGIVANSMTKTFNVDRVSIGRYSDLASKVTLPDEKGIKTSIDMSRLVPGSFINYLRPDVIVFLKRHLRGRSRIVPLNQMEVFGRLLKQSVLSSNREISRQQLQFFGKLVRQVRGFELLSGQDIFEQTGTLLSLLRTAGGNNADH